ncbi:MAG: 50S ribosomal protein L18 [Candidatus Falkowbacteria bacterium]|nr:50S ribosomal protein L18 [Candidatus Falkowbacteria bacterium]
MNKNIAKNKITARRKARTRAKISGTALKPRLCVFRSNVGLYLQLIDDEAAHTLVSADMKELPAGKITKIAASLELGKLLAKKKKKKKIKEVVFDRGAYKYHGRVKAVADGAREGGLQF